jgi:diguanylate cyclase (GGDEF)-like protein
MVLLATAPIFVFASPIFNLMLTFAATTAFVILNFLFVDSPTQDYNVLMLSPVVPIAVFFNWFSNRYRILLSFTTLKIEEERDKYQAQSTIDELTRLGNRRDFEQRFERYLTNYRKNENYLCLAIMDIDFFKKYNDFYGHPKGDECLRLIGMALTSTWDNSSIYAARLGGEEFALLWFEEDMSNAKNVILQIKDRIRALNIKHEKSGVSSFVTFSIGMYIVECGAGDTMQDMYNSVDAALYEAKGRGRNNAVIFYKDKRMYVR